MNTTSLGSEAEHLVTEELKRQGYEILAKNWKRRVCEIDIVAAKDRIVYFIEVKYRSRDGQGSGLEYITPRKLKQMEFAARLWATENDWEGDYRLMAAEVRSDTIEPVVERVIEL